MAPTQKAPRLHNHLESSDEELSPLHKSHTVCITPKSSLKSLPQSQTDIHLTDRSDSSDNHSVSSRLTLNSDHSFDGAHSTSQECKPLSREITYFPPKPESCDADCDSAHLPLYPKTCDVIPESSNCDEDPCLSQDNSDAHLPVKSKRPDSYDCDGNFNGNVPCSVSPGELRRKNSKLYNRKLTQYLLFRSDQHFLYRSCIFIFGSLISAILFYILWFTDLYWVSIRRINVLEPDNSISFRNFHKIPVVDNTFCITVFNITNLEEFYNSRHTAVLDIQPVGPYCFREDLEKIDIRFNENRTRVSYRENSTFHYLPHQSNASLDDVVSVISFPYLTITSRVSDMNIFARLAFSTQLNTAKYSPFVTLNVRDFFYGYDDEFLTWTYNLGTTLGFHVPYRRFSMLQTVSLSNMSGELSNVSGEFVRWTYNLGTTLGFHVPYRRFSMLQTLLDQINSNFSVDTGRQNIDTLQRVQSYNGRPEISAWRGDPCMSYDGTDGTFYESARVTRRDNVSFFSNFLCRNVRLAKLEEMDLFKVSTVPRYSMVPDLFHYNETEDDCYCLDPPCIDNLFYTGDCFPGPIVFSYKYFYGVDPQHLSHLSSLPDPGDWKTYFDVFPALGSAVSSTQRIQINLMVRKGGYFNHPSYFEHKTVLPGVYLERTFPSLTFEAYWYLFHSTFTLPTLEFALKYALVPLNLFFLYYWSSVLFHLCKYVVLGIKIRLPFR